MKPKFKKFDKVRVKKDLKPIKRDFPLDILRGMTDRAGKEYVVYRSYVHAFEQNCITSMAVSYSLYDDTYYWPEDALELVES